jgi:hypothetical protein
MFHAVEWRQGFVTCRTSYEDACSLNSHRGGGDVRTVLLDRRRDYAVIRADCGGIHCHSEALEL